MARRKGTADDDERGYIWGNTGLMVLPERRTVYINDAIKSEMSAAFNLALLDMEAEAPDRDITVYINSPGGEVTAGLSMVDTMMTVSCDVRTVCVGDASSMAAVILMCGTKGKRQILPHSTVLIHQPVGGTGMMQAADILIYADTLAKRKSELFRLMAEMTGQSVEKITSDCDRNYTLSASEAMEYGIVDSIVQKHRGKEK